MEGPGNLALLHHGDALSQAIERFSEASSRLEARYEALRHEAEELRRQLAEKDRELKRSEKLAVLGETAARFAHEVRNPLGAMRLFVSLLQRELNDRPQSLELLDQIGNSMTAVEHVVSNMLTFAKRAPRQFAPINLHAIILGEMAQFERAYAARGLKLRSELSGNPFLQGSEHELRQVLHNLLLNAAQATAYNGTIEVLARDCGAQLELMIRDNGPGIPAALMENLFDPFITSKSDGTGLGLAIVRKIISEHQGDITVGNGAGACFTIVLPRSQKSTDIQGEKR